MSDTVPPRSEGLAAPAVGWASGALGVVQAADREIARQVAVRARAVAEFAASRPASVDRAQGVPGAMSAERWAGRAEVLRPVSEWATAELAVACNLTRPAAEALLAESLTVVHRLPGTLVALEAGVLHRGHLWHLVDKVAPIGDDVLRGQVEAELLDWVGRRRQVTTPAQLGARARVVVARRDAAAVARRLAAALTERGVYLRAERAEGMACVSVVCTVAEARALHAALLACADALTDDPDADSVGADDPDTGGGDAAGAVADDPDTGSGDAAGAVSGPPRTRGHKAVDALLDLVLRPGESDVPPVRVLLHVVASVATLLGGDAPGEIDGEPVPAEMARQLARAFAGLHPVAGDTEPADSESAGTERNDSEGSDTASTDSAGTAAAAAAVGAGTGDANAVPVEPEMPVRGDAAAGVPGGDPVDAAGGPIERAEAELDADDFDRWLAELVDEAFRNAPAPGDPGWSPGAPPEPEPPEPELPEAEPPGVGDRRCGGGDLRGWDAGRALDHHDATASATTAGVTTAGAPHGVPGGGWWAAADRAVDDAGAAVHAAGLALAHADRAVGTALRAHAAVEADWAAGPAGRVNAAHDTLGALAAATDTQRAELAALLAATGGGGLVDRPRIVLTDAVSGALRALTDLPGLRRAAHCDRPACRRSPDTCGHDLTARPGLGPPTPTAGYTPGAALDVLTGDVGRGRAITGSD
ncbi:DUF222 domain-containing protein [Geodermatophilus sp. DSM 44513]|uniref:DUF222 domain-containing protein n=1 Tax=Geodermatophilus sp. DSM 44513 TaxID=1528104 RepID=UPI001AA14B51|nr:DUF222 domain-containing protein [Geodermatophilus sp. DSM 44513]WNV75134.1 HNH endonuclease [Geodermatophilus sp. DSM 44513]